MPPCGLTQSVFVGKGAGHWTPLILSGVTVNTFVLPTAAAGAHSGNDNAKAARVSLKRKPRDCI